MGHDVCLFACKYSNEDGKRVTTVVQSVDVEKRPSSTFLGFRSKEGVLSIGFRIKQGTLLVSPSPPAHLQEDTRQPHPPGLSVVLRLLTYALPATSPDARHAATREYCECRCAPAAGVTLAGDATQECATFSTDSEER
ncbi:hypothetical protein EVAR_6978_1 [Eumeta japonica]|uniref:Uncharacterized protein n=1 Tax=Eumeta variegata TaxID=151549 RepID=A0A4C1TK22_EUMVA|nr:hypothetical protein EVAR_6978_1 [Eumeta japonica]